MKLRKLDIKRGSATCHLDKRIPSDPDDSLDLAMLRILDKGYRVIRRKQLPAIILGMAAKFSITVPMLRAVVLSRDWDKLSTRGRARVLWHELPHVRQQLKWRNFLGYYLTVRGRWHAEVQSYRQSMRALKALGYTRRYRDWWLESRVKSIRKVYKLKRLDRKQYERETRRILAREL